MQGWTTTPLLLPVLLSLLSTASGFVVFSVGNCPNIPAIPNFDLLRYQGRWYNYENFDAPFQLGLSCVSATYGIVSNSTVAVLNAGYMDIMAFGRLLHRDDVEARGKAIVVNPLEPSKLYVSFGDQPDFSLSNQPRPNYQIVDTDYNTYSLVYSCTKFPYAPLKIESAWILTRYQALRPNNADELKAVLEGYNVETKNFKLVDHYQC